MVTSTYSLTVDWDGNGTPEDDIAADVLSITCSRGRDYASQLTGRAKAGTLTAMLRNEDGRYSPFLTTGPLYGTLLPGRKVILKADDGGGATTLWTGFVDTITPVSTSATPQAELRCTGPLRKLTSRRVPVAASSGAATGTLIDNVLDAIDWPAGDRDTDTGQTTTGAWFIEDKDALTAIRELEDTELGFVYEGLAYDVAFRNRHYRLLTASSLTSQATFSDASATQPYTSIEEQDPLRDIYNVAKATIRTYTTAAEAVLWTLNETPVLPAGASRIWWAEPSDLNTLYVALWTTPVVGTDVTQTGVANGDIAVAVSKFARSMKITVTNNHAALPATLTLVQAKGTAVTLNDQTSVNVEDATSQTAYGERSYALPAKWLASTNEAQDYCDYIVGRYKDPHPVVAITWVANRNAAAMTTALDLAINNRVTVTATGARTKLGINEDFYIEAIAHRIRPREHSVTIELSPVSGEGGYWILGTSTLGVDTKLGY